MNQLQNSQHSSLRDIINQTFLSVFIVKSFIFCLYYLHIPTFLPVPVPSSLITLSFSTYTPAKMALFLTSEFKITSTWFHLWALPVVLLFTWIFFLQILAISFSYSSNINPSEKSSLRKLAIGAIPCILVMF